MTSPLDKFTPADVSKLLNNKYILILGDSIIKSLYKDLILFCGQNNFLSEKELRTQGEKRFYGDHLISGNNEKVPSDSVNYEEVREYTAGGRCRLRFYFLTRCYSSYIKNVIFNDINNQTVKPDMIIMNSCLWDISQYGVNSMKSYQSNIDIIMRSFRQLLPEAPFLWLSALPVSNTSSACGLSMPDQFIRTILPGLIRDGNYYCFQMSKLHHVLYIDVHTAFSAMLHLRQSDGINWCGFAYRLVNEIILNHIKAYYHDITSFKCLRLRAELGHKIKDFKRRFNDENKKSKIDHLDCVISQENRCRIEQLSTKHNSKASLALKRKRTDSNDEKNNAQHHQQITQKSKLIKTEPKTIFVETSMNQFDISQDTKLKTNSTNNVHCEHVNTLRNDADVHRSISSSNTVLSENIRNPYLSKHNISVQIAQMKTEESCIERKLSKSTIIEISSVINTNKQRKMNVQDCITISSDEENEATKPTISSFSMKTVLPIYLLNHLG